MGTAVLATRLLPFTAFLIPPALSSVRKVIAAILFGFPMTVVLSFSWCQMLSRGRFVKASLKFTESFLPLFSSKFLRVTPVPTAKVAPKFTKHLSQYARLLPVKERRNGEVNKKRKMQENTKK